MEYLEIYDTLLPYILQEYCIWGISNIIYTLTSIQNHHSGHLANLFLFAFYSCFLTKRVVYIYNVTSGILIILLGFCKTAQPMN